MITTVTFSATITFNFDKEMAELSIDKITPRANYKSIQKYLHKYIAAELKSRTSLYKRFLKALIKLLERLAK